MNIAFRIGIYLAIAISLPTSAAAEDRRRHDRRIEKAAAQRVSADLGDIRGTISPETKDPLYSVAPRQAKKRLGFPIIRDTPAKSVLPPVVMIVFSGNNENG